MKDRDWIFPLSKGMDDLPDEAPDATRFSYALRHGSMKLGLYGPRGIDTQSPHKQDELYVIVSGSGYFNKNGERQPFCINDVIFVEAGAEHRFEEFTEDFLAWVIFWGPEGGER